MRVVAARFPDKGTASAALSALRRSLELSPRDAAIAPLGTPGEKSAGETLLAGRFRDSETPLVADVVRERGGEIVVDVDERWTVPQTRQAQPTVQGGHPATERRTSRERDLRRQPISH